MAGAAARSLAGQVEGGLAQALGFAHSEEMVFDAEISMDGVAPVLASAVHDATGVWIRRVPYTPERVWRALHQAEPAE